MKIIDAFLRYELQGVNSSLIKIGDFCLQPYRYFFNGKSISAVNKDDLDFVYHVSSFVKNKKSISDCPNLQSKTISDKRYLRFLKTTLMIVSFVPGIIFGSIFKFFGFLFYEDVIHLFSLALKHFNPIDIVLGSLKFPISQESVVAAIQKIKSSPLNQKVRSLAVIGDGNVDLGDLEDIAHLNPGKLILKGAKLSLKSKLQDKLLETGKWQEVSKKEKGMVHFADKTLSSVVDKVKAKSVSHALSHCTKKNMKGKALRAVYVL